MFRKLQYGRAGSVLVPAVVRGSADFAIGGGSPTWAPALGDVKVVKDDDIANAANIATLPVFTAVGNQSAALGLYAFSGSELTCKALSVLTVDATTKLIEDDFLDIITTDHPLAQEPNGVSHYGVVAGGALATITLTGGHSYKDNFYQGHLIRLKYGGLTTVATPAKSATAEKWKTTATFKFYKAGVLASKTATDNLTFSSAHTVNNGQAAGTFWGCIVLQYDGTNFSTKVVSADQTYASEAAALNAARGTASALGVTPDAGCVIVGFITINSKVNVRWTANTDDMTAASDCTSSTFYEAQLIGGEEALNSVASYTASTLQAVCDRNWKYIPVQSVDEVWFYGAPNGSTLAEFADYLIGRSTKGGSNPALGNGETLGEVWAAGGAGKITQSGGGYDFYHGDGTPAFSRTRVLASGRAPIDGLT